MSREVVGSMSEWSGILKDFFRQIDDGSLTLAQMRAVVEHRNPFPVFLSLEEQFEGFCEYREWLCAKHASFFIPNDEVAEWKEKIEAMVNLPAETLLFYCHRDRDAKPDIVRTVQLAWEYICSYRKRTWKSKSIVFKKDRMKLADGEPERQIGFYAMKRPSEDKKAIGLRFKEKSVEEVRENLRSAGHWGMAHEGIQFVGITHKHYPELMDGDRYPLIDLPGLAVRSSHDFSFSLAPVLDFVGSELELCSDFVAYPHFYCGSGSLQQCS